MTANEKEWGHLFFQNLRVEVLFIKKTLSLRDWLDSQAVSDLSFCLIMEHKHPSVWTINSIVCSKLWQRSFLLPHSQVTLIVDHSSDDHKVHSYVLSSLCPSPQHSLCMKGRSDAITREIQTHSSDIPLHFLFIVCKRTVGNGEANTR